MSCPTCEALRETVAILKAQLEAQNTLVQRLTAAPPAAAPSQGLVPVTVPGNVPGAPPSIVYAAPPPPDPPDAVEQAPTEADLRRQMADFIDEHGQPCVMVGSTKVPLEELNRVTAMLDFAIGGGRLA